MAVAELRPGTHLGPTADGGHRYEVRETLGTGGFGITYLARDTRLAGDVVIKELASARTAWRDTATGRLHPAHGHAEAHVKLVQRFVREARLLNRIRSPHIVRVTDVWEERGTAYYAMDKVDGEPLGELPSDAVTTDGWAEARRNAAELLDALDAVHAAGLLHGDVKPANVLLDRRIGVVLIDFGTAREGDEVGATVTSTSFTRGYAPPELMHLSRVREAGPWSDLYSWAMLVWGLVTRHHGPSGRPVDAVARALGPDPYADAAGQLEAAGVPRVWAEAVAACLALEPGDRPRDVDAVRALATGTVPGGAQAAHLRPADAGGTDGPVHPTLGALVAGGDADAFELLPTEPSEPVDELGEAVSDPDAAARQRQGRSDARPDARARSGAAAIAVGAAMVLAAATLLGAFFATAPRDGSPGSSTAGAGEAGGAAESVGVEEGSGARAGTPCRACGADEVCRSERCVPAWVEGAETTYRAMVRAWNAGESKVFFSTYADPIRCYYDRAPMSQAQLRARRSSHFAAPDASHWVIDSLDLVDVGPGSVVLQDIGRIVMGDGRDKPHERRVRLEVDPYDTWRIAIEVSRGSHTCAPELFAD